ncbi:MmgE/PrpD family protein [Verticiella sediminum]|uniref:MmgE/PrpD family protein n=1 Tax=Verticiella sediminum TaxID=1247510 RepID=A0A556AJJ8_9BURK|nr:MmgE/PrpD family protein [Verticiella sediminum]TSH93084.1 MmgE/PrpD family protein [Verticiella sediminum]
MDMHATVPSLTQRLAEHFVGPRAAAPAEAARVTARSLLLDYLGVALAGSSSESGRIALRYAQHDGDTGQASLIGGAGAGVSAERAAFANAISAHSIELDDSDVDSYLHFSAPVVSAALAAAQVAHRSGHMLLAAIVAGCEMMQRLSRAANPSLRDRCFHSTAAIGVFGATVAAGRLWDLPPVQMVSAIGLAGAQAGGILEFHGPSMQKRFSPGPAARGGLTAARMAQLGYTGQDTVLDGPRGFLRAFTDRADAGALVKDLDVPYRLDIEFKPYACARPIHNAIDCALAIRERHRPDLEQIETIEIARHPSWAHKHRNRTPGSYHAAQMSLEFSVAVALKDGAALLDQYTERNLGDRLVHRLMSRVHVGVDPSLQRGVSCRMVIHMQDGRRMVQQVDYPRGSVRWPLSDLELEAKFRTLAAPVLGEAGTVRLLDAVGNVEACTDIAALMAGTQVMPP